MIYGLEKWRNIRAARHEPEVRRTLARAYWTVLVIFFAFLCLASIGYGVWQFTRPLDTKESEVTVGTGSPRSVLNRIDLQAVLEGFDARAVRFEERQSAPIPTRDPS